MSERYSLPCLGDPRRDTGMVRPSALYRSPDCPAGGQSDQGAEQQVGKHPHPGGLAVRIVRFFHFHTGSLPHIGPLRQVYWQSPWKGVTGFRRKPEGTVLTQMRRPNDGKRRLGVVCHLVCHARSRGEPLFSRVLTWEPVRQLEPNQTRPTACPPPVAIGDIGRLSAEVEMCRLNRKAGRVDR